MKTFEAVGGFLRRLMPERKVAGAAPSAYGASADDGGEGSDNKKGSPPAGADRERGVDTEIARQRGPGGFTSFANPDDLIAKKGLEIYDRMMTDAQVRMAVNYKRFAVISADWRPEIWPATPSIWLPRSAARSVSIA